MLISWYRQKKTGLIRLFHFLSDSLAVLIKMFWQAFKYIKMNVSVLVGNLITHSSLSTATEQWKDKHAEKVFLDVRFKTFNNIKFFKSSFSLYSHRSNIGSFFLSVLDDYLFLNII